MSDNGAVLAGFTKEVCMISGTLELFLLIRPGTDLNECFKAWDMDAQEWIEVDGWRFDVED